MGGMYAMTISQPGGPEVLTWSEVPDPRPAADEVLIEIVATAVNRADLLQREGQYPPPAGAPAYPGLECAGRIIEIGSNVTTWRVGDEVCALLAGGGYAERVAVAASQTLPIPNGVDLRDAAALPEAACTVWSNLASVARLSAGETLLVHGGGSGIGTFAIQYGVAVGATVITTARPPKHDALRALGAAMTVDYLTEDFVSVTRQATGGRGADVILDLVGGSYLARNVRALATDGRLVVIAIQGGRRAELDLGTMLRKRATVVATTLRGRPECQKAEIVAGVCREVWPLIAAGQIGPVIDRAFPMSQAALAHSFMAEGNHLGKLLLMNESCPTLNDLPQPPDC
jgi:putative PIG3 family NAD(P)H quinone oxidoreductase